jgi:Tol biopolymer transport system component
LEILRIHGTQVFREVWNTDADYEEPSWSPDGTTIVFVGKADLVWGRPQIFKKVLGESYITNLSMNEEVETQPYWNCDGYIYFVRGTNLWRMLPDGSGKTLVTDLLHPTEP